MCTVTLRRSKSKLVLCTCYLSTAQWPHAQGAHNKGLGLSQTLNPTNSCKLAVGMLQAQYDWLVWTDCLPENAQRVE